MRHAGPHRPDRFRRHGGIDSLLAELRTLLLLGAGHIAHEEAHIHPQLLAREATAVLDVQHAEHRASFRDIDALIAALADAPRAARPALGHRLYLAWSLFIAHDFEHMHEEETVNNARLWRLFNDDELRTMEAAIVASLPPEKVLIFLSRMLPSLTCDERASFLGAARGKMPPEAFASVIVHAVRPVLSRADMVDLEGRLGRLEPV